MGLLHKLFGIGRKTPHRVQFNDEVVTFIESTGKKSVVRWSELEEVGILTTDEGPAVDDVFWVLVAKVGGFAVPSESLGAKELLAKLQKLPGFDNETVIKAMGSAENAKFVCWRRNVAL